MKKIEIPNITINRDLSLAAAWVQQHGKRHVSNVSQLISQIERYNRKVKSVKRSATSAAILTFAFLAWFIYRGGETLAFELISLTLFLTGVIYVSTYVFLYDFWKAKNIDVCDSVRAYARDWKNLQPIMRSYYGITEGHLHELGDRIADAEDMKQPEIKASLKKTFNRDHRTLLAFGIARSENHGTYIPNRNNSDGTGTVTNTVRPVRR